VNPTGRLLTLSQGGTVLGVVAARVQALANPQEASARLQQIASEQPNVSPSSIIVDGNSGIERQMLSAPTFETDSGGDTDPNVLLTGAVAAGATVVRFESQLPSTSSAATISQFFAIDRDFTPDEIPDLEGSPLPILPTVQYPLASAPPPQPTSGFGSTGQLTGELEIAATSTASVVMYGT
jgi:hypothetical protein